MINTSLINSAGINESASNVLYFNASLETNVPTIYADIFAAWVFNANLDTLKPSLLAAIPTFLPRGEVVSRRIYCDFVHNLYDDIRVPIKSATGILRDGAISGMNIVIQNADSIDLVLDKYINGGSFKLLFEEFFLNGDIESEYSSDFIVQSLRSDRGSKSHSLTVYGNYTSVVAPVVYHELQDVSFINVQANGDTRLRCALIRNFKQGDVGRYEGVDYRASSLTYVISANNQYMEIAGG